MSQTKAKKLYEKACKACKTSIFKWKPDQDDANLLLMEAIDELKTFQNDPLLMQCYIKQAEVSEKSSNLWDAATSYERLSQIIQENEKDNIEKCIEYAKKASILYRQDGYNDSAVRSLNKLSIILAGQNQKDCAVERCLLLEISWNICKEDEKCNYILKECYPIQLDSLISSTNINFNKIRKIIMEYIEYYPDIKTMLNRHLFTYLLTYIMDKNIEEGDNQLNLFQDKYENFILSNEGKLFVSLLDSITDGDNKTYQNLCIKPTITPQQPLLIQQIRSMKWEQTNIKRKTGKNAEYEDLNNIINDDNSEEDIQNIADLII